jgi:hypothetical protein
MIYDVITDPGGGGEDNGHVLGQVRLVQARQGSDRHREKCKMCVCVCLCVCLLGQVCVRPSPARA